MLPGLTVGHLPKFHIRFIRLSQLGTANEQNRTTFPKENVTQLLGSMWFARHFAYGDGKTMTKSLPSASILSREDICATAKTPGLVIPFSQHACGHC
jgi:hypothetical protein